LGIQTGLDRVIRQPVARVLGPLFEKVRCRMTLRLIGLVKSANATKGASAPLIRYCKSQLQLIVNHAKPLTSNL